MRTTALRIFGSLLALLITLPTLIHAATPTVISGTIWDGTNNMPLAGAYIEANDGGNSTYANSIGFFHLHNTPDTSSHYIKITKTGYAFFQDNSPNWTIGSSNSYNPDIYIGALITGTIRERGTNNLLQGVTVSAENDPQSTSKQDVFSDASGYYELRQPPGTIRLWANEPNHAPSKTRWVITDDQQNYTGNNSFLYIGGTISGTVTYEDTGLPVIGATLDARLTYDDSHQFKTFTVTNGSGYYEFTHLYPAPYTIVVSAPTGYADGRRTNVDVIDQGITTFIDFALIGGGDLQGNVSDYSGNPVADADVTIFPANGNSANRKETTTDGLGDYSLTGIEAGEYSIQVSPKQGNNLQTEQVSGIHMVSGATVMRHFTLQVGGKLTGIISDHLGQPVEGTDIRVYLDLQYPFDQLFKDISSNSSGYYEIDGLSPYQSYTVSIGLPVTNTINAQALVKNMTVAENTVKIQNVSLPTGCNRSGIIVDTSSNPVTDGMAIALSSGFTSGNEFSSNSGSYIMRNLPVNDYLQITVPQSVGNYQNNYEKFHATSGQDTTYNITLPEGGVVEGIVFDADGNSASGVRLLAIQPSGLLASMPFFSKESFTDLGGYYRLERLENGVYSIVALPTVEETGGLSTQSISLTIVAGQTTQRDFYLSADGAKVYGTVRDQYGNRIVEGMVAFWNDSTIAYGTTDRWGNYSLMLAPGTYSGQAQYTSMLGANLAVEPTSNIVVSTAPNTHNKEFVMQLGGTVSGKVLDQVGQPVSLSIVKFYQDNNPIPYHVALCDQYGNYEVSGLHTGLYNIITEHESYSTGSGTTYVTMGGTIKNQNIVVVAATSIAGTVRGENNRLIQDALVKIFPSGSSTALLQQLTDSSGSFILEPLSNGTYDIKASATGLKSITQTNLNPGDRADFTLDSLISQEEAISYPNPGRGNQLTFLYWLDNPATVLIRVFNQTGELVWDWEGPGLGNQYNKHIWQISGVAPGVYLYKITAREENGSVKHFPNRRLTVIK